MFRKKKGVATLVAILGMALILIGTSVAFIAGSIWGRQHAEEKYLFEAGLISKSDKVETYVRSFLRATDISSFQAIHDSGNEQIVLPYDFNPSGYPKYSDKYNMSYWQIYNEVDKRMPPASVMLNKMRQEVSWISSCYLYNYQKAFRDFAQTSDPEMIIPDPSASSIIVGVTFGDEIIYVEGEETVFQKISEVADQEIEIERRFNPYSEVNTSFEKIIEKAESIVYDDLLGKLIRNETPEYYHDMSSQEKTQDELGELADDLSESRIIVLLNITDGRYTYLADKAAAIINVTIYDNTTNYTFYDFPTDKATIRYLGVNFLAKAGHDGVISNTDEVPAQNLINPVGGCFSGLGIISKKEVCNFFTVTPTVCQDPDGLDYTTASTCTDSTGSYNDLRQRLRQPRRQLLPLQCLQKELVQELQVLVVLMVINLLAKIVDVLGFPVPEAVN